MYRLSRLLDVGQTLCVQGKLIEIVDKPNSFMLVFSNKPGAFYWVSYDIVWSQAKVDTCYQIRGKINQIANSPILVFDYSNSQRYVHNGKEDDIYRQSHCR